MTLNDLRLRIRALFLRARVEQELEDEVAFHVAMSRQRYLAAGHAEEEASRLARLDFGRVGAMKEDCRGARGIDNVESALQDIRYALRTFQRNPGFLLTVSGTIALGLALNLALFTLFASAASAFPPYRRALFRLVEPQREPGTRAGGSLHWGGSP